LEANKTYYQSIVAKRRPTLSFGQPWLHEEEYPFRC
jgi:hypothetical protein